MATENGDSAATPDTRDLDKLPLKLELMKGYMDEHYAAARHHQTLRVPTLAFLASAAVVLFTRALELSEGNSQNSFAGWYIGWGIIALGLFALIANRVFHRSNRLHSETAANCRKIIALYLESPECRTRLDSQTADPGWVRKAVEKAMSKHANPKFEDVLRAAPIPIVEEAGSEKDSDGKKDRWLEGLKIGQKLSLTFDLVPFLMLVAGFFLLFVNRGA